MDCPACEGPTYVLETRRIDGGAAIRRRRECRSCGRRLTSTERREPEPLYVRKRSGERERFDRTKLRAALLSAAHKRPVRADQIERLVDGIESAMRDAGGEMPSRRVGELCLAGLQQLDAGAYLQFAGVFDPAVSGRPGEAGSVRPAREDAELPAQAASRRGING